MAFTLGGHKGNSEANKWEESQGPERLQHGLERGEGSASSPGGGPEPDLILSALAGCCLRAIAEDDSVRFLPQRAVHSTPELLGNAGVKTQSSTSLGQGGVQA